MGGAEERMHCTQTPPFKEATGWTDELTCSEWWLVRNRIEEVAFFFFNLNDMIETKHL